MYQSLCYTLSDVIVVVVNSVSPIDKIMASVESRTDFAA